MASMMLENPQIANLSGPRAAQSFSPYDLNGGTIVGVAGKDFAVIGSDTRLCGYHGYTILTRNQPKLFQLSDKIVLGCGGCWCDTLTLTKILKTRMKMYLLDHHKEISVRALAQLMSNVLYGRRFFPYYVELMLAGVDDEGGVVFNYDCVGNYESSPYFATGASQSMLVPFLDSQVGGKNMGNQKLPEMTIQRASRIVKDGFISAAERETKTGDGIALKIITKDGITDEKITLRKD